MFNKNVFTQTDVVADLIKDINEADYKAKMEALKGNQHKIDKNKNNKVDADDFKILRGEKKVNEDQVEEATSVKIPTPTGTRVLGHRYGNAAKTHRDSMADPFAVVKGPGQKDIEDLEKKKVKKEEIDPEKVTTDTLAGRVKGKTGNPFAPKKVMMDVSGNVNEEELDEASFDPLKHVKNPSPAVKTAAKDVKRGSYADRAALMKAGGVKDDRGPRGVTQEEAEQQDEAVEKKTDFMDRQKRLAAASSETQKDPARLKRMSGIPGYTAAMDLAKKTTTKEEVEILDEGKMDKSSLSSLWHKHAHHSYFADQGYGIGSGSMNHNSAAATAIENHVRKHHGNKVADDMVDHSEHHVSHAEYAGPKDSEYHEKEMSKLRKKHKIDDPSLHEETQLDERSLSPAEKDAVEVNVKAMKKNLAGFKARYGKDAKSVMYATSTKQAKKD